MEEKLHEVCYWIVEIETPLLLCLLLGELIFKGRYQ